MSTPHSLASLLFFFLIFWGFLFLVDAKQVSQATEVAFHDQADTLCVQTVSSEISIIRLVIYPESHVAIREYQIA